MNYADMALGTWYPMGGMYKLVEGMVTLAKAHGVDIQLDSAVQHLEISRGNATGLWSNGRFHKADFVIGAADYHHVEQQLVSKAFRHYSEHYWRGRVMAPSALLFYVAVNKKMKTLLHHTLFFDQDFSLHAREIYDDPKWPTAPQFYVSSPSKTDPSLSPAGHESLLILIPIAPGLNDEEEKREKYFNLVMDRIENITGEKIRAHIMYKRSYAHNDFISDYNAFRGNAYGMANTLWQTANFKPSMISRKVGNLFYAGHLTVPGPGVPPAIISGQVAAGQLIKKYRKSARESAYETGIRPHSWHTRLSKTG